MSGSFSGRASATTALVLVFFSKVSPSILVTLTKVFSPTEILLMPGFLAAMTVAGRKTERSPAHCHGSAENPL
ncbi:hypothetical protein IWZ01DRAFT_516330, partial [Phyllosticta capitalensis]